MMRLLLCAALLAAGALSARAAGSEDAGGGSQDLQKAVAEVKAGRYPEAIKLLNAYVSRSPRDADGHNWLGYAYRKSGQLEPAFAAYRKALQIDPRHKGAHEYVGEAYLQAGKPEEAEKHLKQLAEICKAKCEEYEDLEKALVAYRAQAAAAK